MLTQHNFVLYNPQGQEVSHSSFMTTTIGSIGDEVYAPTYYYTFTSDLFEEWLHFVCNTPYPLWFSFSTKVVSVTRQLPSSTTTPTSVIGPIGTPLAPNDVQRQQFPRLADAFGFASCNFDNHYYDL